MHKECSLHVRFAVRGSKWSEIVTRTSARLDIVDSGFQVFKTFLKLLLG